jgi:peptidoglycan hydrolase-like protein with peptidoglycan-binding domain
MMKLTTAACALALGIVWAAAPAIAQDTTKEKAEKKADRIEQKAEGKTDTVGGKMERAWDKTKAKTKEMKDNVMGKGDASTDVRSAQQALKGKGFNPGPVDGVMGPRTTAAVKEFQQKENLTVSGSLDADTNARLMASVPPPAASPASEPPAKKQSQ